MPHARSCLVMILAALAACAGSKPAARKKPVDQDAALVDMCVRTFVRQRDCTEDFLPKLVALRVRVDRPAGIARKDAEVGRDAMLAEARSEWAVDRTDEAISKRCTESVPVMVAKVPPDQLAAMKAESERCLAAATCAEFTDCILPFIERQITAE
jgi:hypothetical protein